MRARRRLLASDANPSGSKDTLSHSTLMWFTLFLPWQVSTPAKYRIDHRQIFPPQLRRVKFIRVAGYAREFREEKPRLTTYRPDLPLIRSKDKTPRLNLANNNDDDKFVFYDPKRGHFQILGIHLTQLRKLHYKIYNSRDRTSFFMAFSLLRYPSLKNRCRGN